MSKQIHSKEDTAQLKATLGNRVRTARKAQGITQVTAAERIGISSEFFARLERGNALPSVTTLINIANGLKVTVDFLFGADDDANEIPAPMPEPAPVKIPRQIQYIADQARNDPDLTRTLISLLKLCEKREQTAETDGDPDDGDQS